MNNPYLTPFHFRSFLMNMELTQLAPTMVTLTFN